MSDILDDLKMMADHCDQENGDEPCDLGMLLVRAIAEIRNLRQQPVSAAEVPMPEPVGFIDRDDDNTWATLADNAYGLSNLRIGSKVFAADQMRTYGDTCRAAGEAAGYARGLDKCISHINTIDDGDSPAYRHCQEALAALRGEVK